MDIITRFGMGEYEYTFDPDHQIKYSCNFADMVPRTIRLPGMSGGFDEFASALAPAEIGKVEISFWLHTSSNAEMVEAVQNLRKIASRGKMRLFRRDLSNDVSYCWARVNHIETPMVSRDRPHKQIKARVIWQASDPHWYRRDGMHFMDDGHDMDDGLVMVGPQVDRQSVADGGTVSVTNNGNAPARPWIRFEYDDGAITDPCLYRVGDAGYTIDSLTYNHTFASGDTAEIDCRDYNVFPDYGNLDMETADWMLIPPGTHTLTVSGTFGGNHVKLSVYFEDTYL